MKTKEVNLIYKQHNSVERACKEKVNILEYLSKLILTNWIETIWPLPRYEFQL